MWTGPSNLKQTVGSVPCDGQVRNRPLLTRRNQGRLLGRGSTGVGLEGWVRDGEKHSKEREWHEQRAGNTGCVAEEQTALE